MHVHFTALMMGNTENGFQKFCSSAAHQTCHTEDFAFAQLETYIHTGRHIFSCQISYIQQNFARLVCFRRETICQVTTYHELNDLICCQIFCVFCCDPLTVTHDGNFVGNLQNFFHLMADVNHCNASVTQFVDDAEQVLYFFMGQ